MVTSLGFGLLWLVAGDSLGNPPIRLLKQKCCRFWFGARIGALRVEGEDLERRL